MSIKDQIITKAFREINGFKSVSDSCDTFKKLSPRCKTLIRQGVPAHTLAKASGNHKQKFGNTEVNM